MIPVEQLLFNLDQKTNNLAKLKGQYIPEETKIEVLNIAQTKLVLRKLGLNNNYQMGMDSFSKRYQDLQVLVVPSEKHTMTRVTGDLNNSYSMPLSALSHNMIIPVESYVTATAGVCKNRQLDIIVIVKHSDLREYLLSPHFSPSFEYQETIATVSSDTFYVYVDSGNTFSINDLYLTYVRYPVSIDVAGYTHLDGTASANVDCELPGYMENELLDMAVEEIADATGNTAQSQLSRTRTKENE